MELESRRIEAKLRRCG